MLSKWGEIRLCLAHLIGTNMANEERDLHTSTPQARGVFSVRNLSPVAFRPLLMDDSMDAMKTTMVDSMSGYASFVHSYDHPCVLCNYPSHYTMYPCAHPVCHGCVQGIVSGDCVCGSPISGLLMSNGGSSMSSIGDPVYAVPPVLSAEWAIQNLPFQPLACSANAMDLPVVKITNVQLSN